MSEVASQELGAARRFYEEKLKALSPEDREIFIWYLQGRLGRVDEQLVRLDEMRRTVLKEKDFCEMELRGLGVKILKVSR